MNKKFSTLLVGAMLATAFSAGAQKVGDQVLLKASSQYLTVAAETTSAAQFGQVGLTPSISTLDLLNPATWKVSAKKSSLGKTLYSFTNPASGLTLAVDPSLAVTTAPTTPSPLVLGGSATEWIVENNTLVSYFKSDSVVYIAQTGTKFYLAKDAAATTSHADALKLDVNTNDFPTGIVLSATDLNTLLKSVSVEGFFGLTMTPQVSSGEANHLSDTKLQAEPGVQIDHVKLYNGKKVDNKKQYVVVDTAYYTGTESDKFVKFTYDEMDAKGRDKGSYEFKFTYDAKNNNILVQVYKVAYKIVKASSSVTDVAFKAELAKYNNAEWPATDVTPTSALTTTVAKLDKCTDDQYIYMPDLAGKKVLTVKYSSVSPAAPADQNVKIVLGTQFSGLKPTSLAEGIYMIKVRTSGLDKSGVERQNCEDGDYLIANLGGYFGYMPQQKNQDFDHMPAAQWVVKKNGTSDTAPVEIYNREFTSLDVAAGNYNRSFKLNGQLFKAGDNNVFFADGDTLEFIPVSKESVENDKLGYKYVTEDDTKVQSYLFNYLHGLSSDKFLYVPFDKDSIIRVDENGEKSIFRLEIVVKDDKYGYDNSLVRNVYRIKDNYNRNLGYDHNLKKYVFSKTAHGTYFLKENNDKDGKHFYTIIPAIIERTFDKEGKNGQYVVWDHDFDVYDNTGTKVRNVSAKSNDYASSKVSVDDNTLDLVKGNIYDKFINGGYEARTSAFAVEIYDSPLYRRFNNEALGESKTDSAQCLAFVENVRNEYLMDEMNENLQDSHVDYAGIWNAEKAGGKLFFHVDTAWVNRGLGYIKPQYLISVARNDQDGVATEPCTEAGPHIDAEGHITDDPYKCVHANRGKLGFVYGKYLVNFSDSAAAVEETDAKVNPYRINSQNNGTYSYTRVGFVPAIKVGDSLVVLTNGFEKMEPAKLDTATIFKNYRDNKLTKFIVDLVGDKHKNVTWSFRHVNPDKAAGVEAEGEANAFLIESNVYAHDYENDVVDGKYTTVYGCEEHRIAPASKAAWLKMQNGCLVLTDNSATFGNAKTNADGALVFNVEQMAEGDEFVTSNDEIAAEGIAIVAGNGVVTIQG
ncbi:hypothetical protein, partial [Parabacteroides sp. ZJ-118]|uniref:hypothetical protein n=1 Tax=Parabacteroides sp. ZJ-118 TaxID=2709398 RepID=UPI0013EC03C4